MKNYIKNSILFITIFFLTSCGDSPVKKMGKMISGDEEVTNKSEKEDKSVFKKISESGKAVKGFSKMAANAEKTVDQMNKLSEIEPVTQASLKSWLPENIDHYKRTYYSTGEMASAGVISLKSKFTHQEEKDKVVQIEVTDGAGSGMGGIFISGLQRSLDLGIEEETEDSYKKVVEKKGLKAMEEQNDRRKNSSLQFVTNDRFYVKLEGKNVSAEELWKIAEKLNTNKLSQL
ncbi:MAG: hypothetical protein ABI290_08365 [Ginsengibacter sp.]